MTAKEKRHVRNLEIKIENLELALRKSQQTWVEQFDAVYHTRTALFQAFMAIEEAVVIMHDVIKNDPQYMSEWKRIEIAPDF